ncbi:MAG: beta-lactamase family protein [Gemmatimonadota bacterium]|nr:beta-lactamase family protein [Gemmatimonadota bacterium]
MAEWLRVYNAGREDSLVVFVRRAYATRELAARPAEGIVRGHRLWRQNYGTFELLRIDSASAHAIDAFVRGTATGAIGKVYVEVDTSPPHGITGVWLIPFARPPAGLAVRTTRDDAAIVRDLREYASRLAAADLFSGSIVVRRGDVQLLSAAYGLARRDPQEPNTPETRYELASLSKLFTAVAIGQLVEQGKLRFETTLAEALPDYPNAATGGRITIHHLLTHTSGLPDFYRNGKFRQYEDSIRSLRDYWPTFAMDSLWSRPGERHDYSNSNYIVLGAIIEHHSGMAFESYVERHVFAPAGMTSTCYCEPGAPRRATPYSRYTSGFGPGRRSVPDRWIEVPAGAKRPGAPAGGGISTAEDIARFGAALLANRLLSPEMTTRLLTPRVSMDGDGHRGYGFEVHDWFGTGFVGHGGNFWGVMSQLDIYPETGHVVVVLANNDASGGEAVRNWTRRRLAAFSEPASTATVPLDCRIHSRGTLRRRVARGERGEYRQCRHTRLTGRR